LELWFIADVNRTLFGLILADSGAEVAVQITRPERSNTRSSFGVKLKRLIKSNIAERDSVVRLAGVQKNGIAGRLSLNCCDRKEDLLRKVHFVDCLPITLCPLDIIIDRNHRQL
jgi:hypothetical protein